MWRSAGSPCREATAVLGPSSPPPSLDCSRWILQSRNFVPEQGPAECSVAFWQSSGTWWDVWSMLWSDPQPCRWDRAELSAGCPPPPSGQDQQSWSGLSSHPVADELGLKKNSWLEAVFGIRSDLHVCALGSGIGNEMWMFLVFCVKTKTLREKNWSFVNHA